MTLAETECRYFKTKIVTAKDAEQLPADFVFQLCVHTLPDVFRFRANALACYSQIWIRAE